MMKILVIEDDLEIRKNLKQLLEEHGYQVYVIDDFKNILEDWKKKYQDTDLILLDIQIPYMNGE